MCPPESCCCCKLPLGVKIGAALLLALELLSLVLVFTLSDENLEAFCDLEDLEATAECGESCAVHESGAWYTADPNFHTFSDARFPGYTGKIVPVVPLCSTGQGAQKTFTLLVEDGGSTPAEALAACEAYGDDTALASIASADENERARKACGDNSCWLGLRSLSATKWSKPVEWTDGTPFDYANWWPVNQPPAQEDPEYPQLNVLMNVPGEEPGEHCTALTIHFYFGVLAMLVICGLCVLALIGANSEDGSKLDIVWQGWAGVWAITSIQSAIETWQTIDLIPFLPPFLVWLPWIIGQVCIALPLNLWWIISVRSLAKQCKDGKLGSEDSG